MILSGGEKMDIVPILVEQVNSMVNAKQVIDMSEYIDKYGNNIKELLGDTAKAANIGNYVYGVTTEVMEYHNFQLVMPVICYYAKRYSG